MWNGKCVTVHRVSSAAGDNGQEKKLGQESAGMEKKTEKITILYLRRYVN